MEIAVNVVFDSWKIKFLEEAVALGFAGVGHTRAEGVLECGCHHEGSNFAVFAGLSQVG